MAIDCKSKWLTAALGLVISLSVHSAPASAADSAITVVPAAEVDWQALNPARGEASPRAATLWGDRQGSAATGFLARFVEGFSSPPHIHNVTYRAVVISGLIHNDDPGAAKMWMPAGSFWTQPLGEVHITAAGGEENLALVETDGGPYLVRPTAMAFDNGERPINLHARTVVWVNHNDHDLAEQGVKIAYLWGDEDAGEAHGSFLRVPGTFSGSLESRGPYLRAVVIAGRLRYKGAEIYELPPGSYFGSVNGGTHRFAPETAEAIVYVHAGGSFEIKAGADEG
ncbi:MAG: DUF4437 domain-containing protein [Pseudomonadota bacterium]